MPILMEALAVGQRRRLLMSVYAVTGLILALPSGLIYQKTGYRVTGIVAGGSIVLGATLGALSQSAGGLLASRVVEGAGTSFMAVLAPAIIAQWFAVRRRGTAMGIGRLVPIGSAAMLILARRSPAWGWRAVWWFGAGYALVGHDPLPGHRETASGRAAAPAAQPAVAPAPRVTSGQVMRNRNICGWRRLPPNAAFIGLPPTCPPS
jgi:MFS family permease